MRRTRGDGASRNGLRPAVCALLAAAALSAAAAPAAHAGAAPRIVGGTEAATADWPSAAFLVALEDTDGNGTIEPSFACTGTVVDASWILTAAHCVLGGDGRTVPRLVVKLGSARIDDAAVPYAAVAEVHVHPAYDAATHRYDAALLRLAAPTTVAAMPLATADGLAAGRYATTPGIDNTAGWGATDAASPSMSPVLRKGYLEPQGDDVCRAAHAAYDPALMLCAVTPDTTAACRGDSGGPLTVVDTETGERALLGVTSFGARACSLQLPAFFTRVPAIAGFIAGYLSGAPVAAAGPDALRSAPAAPVTHGAGTVAVVSRRPVVDSLRLAPRRFRAALTGGRPAVSSGTSAAAAPRRGSTLTFRLSEACSVQLGVERRRTVGGRVTWTAVGARVALAGRAGANSARLTGRVAGRMLRRGGYRVVLLATDADGNRSAPGRTAFTITG